MYVLNNIKRLTLFVTILVLAGCGENLYSLTNKTLLDEMNTDLAYIQNNCEQVIINLEKKQHTIPLSVDEKYQYVSSLLSCSGFDVRASLGMALGPPNDTYPPVEEPASGALDVMYSFINKDSFSLVTIKELTAIYSKALSQCTGRLNNNLRIVCTLVGGASNTLAITKEFLFIFALPSIPADQTLIYGILDNLSTDPNGFLGSKSQEVYPSMFLDDQDFESRLIRSAEAIQVGLKTLDSLIGNSNDGDENLLIFMLENISKLILDPGTLGMNVILSIIILETFGF